jgi:hypothetical protein
MFFLKYTGVYSDNQMDGGPAAHPPAAQQHCPPILAGRWNQRRI